ncbi:MAG: alpha/beta fold hydrolase [Pseudomonadota bacterium]
MPIAHVNGTDLPYEISGNGPYLLLIGGMLSDSATWLPVLPLLEPHFTVIRPDNRATGRHQNVAPFTLPDCADDLAALLSHMNAEDVHVAGHSMGGYLALMLADRAPKRLASLTLLASAAANGHRNFLLFSQALKLRREAEPGFWLRMLYPWLQSPDFFTDPKNLNDVVAAMEAYPHAQSLAAMQMQINALTGFAARPPETPLPCPAQAVLAGRDLLFPLDDARAALAPTPGLTFQVIEDAAHSIHWEAPAEVAAHLRRFAGV